MTVKKERSKSLLACRLVEETKKEGTVDLTQAYSKIIAAIREADHAAKMADKAAEHALQVQETPARTSAGQPDSGCC